MRLLTTTYTEQVAKLPKSGRYIIAQFDEEGVILYQAYRPAIGEFAAQLQISGNSILLSNGNTNKNL
jgi:hypothetical protein